ncbi:MAG: hypothetical protein U9O78_04270 [Patescibacteria group bacterium]|nr:hypothetical protein [Patescibacteria group bacterium]
MKKIATLIKKTKLAVVFTIFLLQSLADLFTPVNPFFGRAGVIIWYISFLPIFIIAFQQLFYLVKNSWNKKSLFTILSLLIIFSLAINNLTKKRSLSGETTQEITCNLRHYQNSADWGFRQNCFLGYPNKQFYLPGSISLLFGRSQLALNSGALIYFFLGSLIFSGATLRALEFNRKNDCLVGTGLAAALHFYFFNHFFLNQFEQSIYPLSLGLIAFGLLLLYKHTKKIIYLPLIGTSLLWLAFSYTPSLALIPLIILLLILANLNFTPKQITKSHWLHLALVVLVVVTSLISSFNYREDVRLVGDGNYSISKISSQLISLAEHFTYSPQGRPFLSPTFTIVFWIILLLAFYKINLEQILLIGWLVGTILIAVFSQGYSYYGLDFRAHRALIIFPVIFYLLVINLRKIKVNQFFLFFFYLIVLLNGLNFSYQFLSSEQPRTEISVIQFVENHSPIETKQKKKLVNYLYFSKAAQADMLSFHDYSQYFWPMTQIKKLSPKNENACLPENNSLLFLNTKEKCWLNLQKNLPQYIKILGYIDVKSEELILLQKNETTY